MDEPEYKTFVGLDETARARVDDIFDYAYKGGKHSASIDSIVFGLTEVEVRYTETVMSNPYRESISFPAKLIYLDDWKPAYDVFANEQEELRKQEIQKKKTDSESGQKEKRRILYEKLQQEFGSEP